MKKRIYKQNKIKLCKNKTNSTKEDNSKNWRQKQRKCVKQEKRKFNKEKLRMKK